MATYVYDRCLYDEYMHLCLYMYGSIYIYMYNYTYIMHLECIYTHANIMVPKSDFPSVFIAQVQILNRPKVQDIG